MTGITACLIASVMFVRAPVPPELKPDPTARGAIGIQADLETLSVTHIFKNMPAEKAGLRVGDRIVRVNSLHPTNFSDVVAHISSFRPGAKIQVEIQRGAETHVFVVTLTARPSDFDQPEHVILP
jgi:S1-C subfamily serine protease